MFEVKIEIYSNIYFSVVISSCYQARMYWVFDVDISYFFLWYTRNVRIFGVQLFFGIVPYSLGWGQWFPWQADLRWKNYSDRGNNLVWIETARCMTANFRHNTNNLKEKTYTFTVILRSILNQHRRRKFVSFSLFPFFFFFFFSAKVLIVLFTVKKWMGINRQIIIRAELLYLDFLDFKVGWIISSKQVTLAW